MLERLIAQIPWERLLFRPKNSADGLKEVLKDVPDAHILITPSVVSSPPVLTTPLESPKLPIPSQERLTPEISLPETIARERAGDWCVACVPNKHLFKARDALSDALNIARRGGQFTDVAEGKVQRAIYNMNGAEEDLELARVSQTIKPAVAEMATQIGKLRNFLRLDQSGLEIATLRPEAYETMTTDLEVAIASVDRMIALGYELTKLQFRERLAVIAQASQPSESER